MPRPTVHHPDQAHTDHPVGRFAVPGSIQAGKAMADWFDPTWVGLVAESLVGKKGMRQAGNQRLVASVADGLAGLSLMQRGTHVANGLRSLLPENDPAMLKRLVAALGPKLTDTKDNGMQPFFYLAHSAWVRDADTTNKATFDAGMRACHALTQVFTSEFCVRAYLVKDQERALSFFNKWVTDANDHVRRLVTEGSRPRLPWGMRLQSFVRDPDPALALLERLKDDPSLYVRRSVANHLGDVWKDHPQKVVAICDRWLQEVDGKSVSAEQKKHRRWVVRHALRHPWKKQDAEAMAVRLSAGHKVGKG